MKNIMSKIDFEEEKLKQPRRVKMNSGKKVKKMKNVQS